MIPLRKRPSCPATLSGVRPHPRGRPRGAHLTFSYPLAGALAYWRRTLREKPWRRWWRRSGSSSPWIGASSLSSPRVSLRRWRRRQRYCRGFGERWGREIRRRELALALQAEGARVGMLGADIYGPSLGLLLGVEDGTRPEVVNENTFVPVTAQGLPLMSMALLTTDRTPMVWRGPMASGALQQMLTQTRWPTLDYLIVDIPPGTGDIALTLSQQVPLAGAVVVTTPQDLALLDARKGIEMFRRVEVPVLGIVENMSIHICSACRHREPSLAAEAACVLRNIMMCRCSGPCPSPWPFGKMRIAASPPWQRTRKVRKRFCIAIWPEASQHLGLP